MRRRIAYGLLALLAALLLAGGGGAAWLAGTPEGARRVLAALSRYTPLTVSARFVEGRLLDRLRLEGVSLSLAASPLSARIDALELRWRPLLLLRGRAVLEELALTGVAIRDDGPAATPADLAWPKVTGLAGLFTARIDRLDVTGLTYRRLAEPPVAVARLSVALAWRNGVLTLDKLLAETPAGRLAGRLAVGLERPSLQLDLEAVPAEPLAALDAFSLQARFSPGLSGEQVAGDFSLSGSAGGRRRLELAGEAGLTRRALRLRKLRLADPDRRGSITGGGTITPDVAGPRLALELAASGLDLAAELGRPTDLSGTLTLVGTPSDYRGEFALANRGGGWQGADLAGAYAGDASGVRLAPLRGSWLAGTLAGELRLLWSDGFSLAGTLRGRDLDPAGIAADWQGVVNLDLGGRVTWPAGGAPGGELSVKLRESRLHGQALTGELQGDFSGTALRIERLTLTGKGFAIRGAGDLARRLELAARVDDLSLLLPDTTGKVRAEGWVRRREGLWSGAFSGRGSDLAGMGFRAADASLTARLGEEKGQPLRLSATLRRAAYGRFAADSLTLTAGGSTAKHTVEAVLRSAGGEVRVALTGAYERESWQGTIERADGRNGFSPWHLGAPAALRIGAGRAALAPLVLAGTGVERLEVAADLTWAPLAGSLRADWREVNLARAKAWLPEALRLEGVLTGQATGKLLAGERLDLAGEAVLGGGRLRWQAGGDSLEADLQTARCSWEWGGRLGGDAGGIAAGRLAVAGRLGAAGVVTLEGKRIGVPRLALVLDGNERGWRAEADLGLSGGGALRVSFAADGPARLAIPETGEMAARGTGVDLALLRPWLPEAMRLEGVLTGQATGKLLAGEWLDLAGEAALGGGRLRWQAGGDSLEADLQTARCSWEWGGRLGGAAGDIAAGRLAVTGRIGAAGAVTLDGKRIGVPQLALSLEGDEGGWRAGLDAALSGGGTLHGTFAADGPARLAIPVAGEMGAKWSGLDLALLRPWLPEDIVLEGTLAGQAAGRLQAGQRIALAGDAALSGGRVRWRGPEGEIGAAFPTAALAWDWREEALSGDLTLALAEHGRLHGRFRLPIPARLPVAAQGGGELQGSLGGQVREQGLLTALFPGLLQESRGEIDVDLRLAGSLEEPRFEGQFRLSGAGAYLPAAGIRLQDLQLTLNLEKDLIRIDAFRVVSGPGQLTGEARIRLDGWRVAGYEGRLDGERFQSVFLPELQILSTPHLTFSGTLEKLTVRGEVNLPEVLISGQPLGQVVQPSRDVIMEGAPKPAARTSPLLLDVQVRLTLGERVLVQLGGIDALLAGSIDLQFQDPARITSRGEIRVVRGRYKTYGVDLAIVRGRLFYAGGPLNQPTLDILALRTVGNVKAGVLVGGNLSAPTVRLYSEPAMPDVDVLAYIVFGRALGGEGGEQAGMMLQAAGLLLSKGQSVVLQENIKNRLGLSTLELQTGGGESAPGSRGYLGARTTPADVAPGGTATGLTETVLTVGKYLTPQLYFSYGRSLFTGDNLFRLRYDLTPQWQIETQTGSASGVDLYYKIQFQ